ncbi:glycosyltransferase [Lysobacter sp. A3-1-A15]|uniref:glycosyltransferase n=1 Tax=Novilysobacter viscosus TaxID=3098602 RepID=UPI002ED79B0C
MSEADGSGEPARRLRILLVAYEFPPGPSPQSLRWGYLTRHLCERGHEVHAMVPDISGDHDLRSLVDPRVRVHRINPGPVRSLLEALARRRPLPAMVDEGSQSPGRAGAGTHATAPPRLNWKGRSLGAVQAALACVMFPDLRAEWLGPALAALPGVLSHARPDVVVASHEPATSLQVALAARARGFALVADLGDPVLAPYTPWWWRRRARRLEARIMAAARHVLVTSEATRALLDSRHGGHVPISLVTQGFERGPSPVQAASTPGSQGPLRLLYAGRFYPFRDPRPLVDAVLAVPGVQLDIASGNVPDWLVASAGRSGGRIRLLGRVPHGYLLGLQRTAHVLVNIANRDPVQVPGKVYEYLGADRPILHITDTPDDAISALLGGLRRGWSRPARVDALARQLERLVVAHQAGVLEDGLDLTARTVDPWSWAQAAGTVERALLGAVDEPFPGAS